MRNFACSSIVALLLLATRSQALPNPAPTYSVVDVDGGRNGQTSGPAQAPVTIYRTVTQSALPPSTVLVTITQQEIKTALVGPSTTTVTVPEIQSFTVTIYATPSLAVSSIEATTSTVLSSSVPTSTSSSYSSSSTIAATEVSSSADTALATTTTVTSLVETTLQVTSTFTTSTPITTVISTVETVLAAISTVSASWTASYDDGFWHTSYPVKPAPSSVPTSFSTAYFQIAYSQTTAASVPSSTASASLLQRNARLVRRSS